jgi:hypothetical protein
MSSEEGSNPTNLIKYYHFISLRLSVPARGIFIFSVFRTTIHQLLAFSACFFYIPLVTYFNKVCYDYFKSVKIYALGICVNLCHRYLWLNILVAAMPRYVFRGKKNKTKLKYFLGALCGLDGKNYKTNPIPSFSIENRKLQNEPKILLALRSCLWSILQNEPNFPCFQPKNREFQKNKAKSNPFSLSVASMPPVAKIQNEPKFLRSWVLGILHKRTQF